MRLAERNHFMAINPKQLRDLKASLKRREQRPEPSYQPPAKLQLTAGERDRITDSHVGVIKAVETMIVDAWHEQLEMDDLDVEQALMTAIRHRQAPGEGPAASLAQRLHQLHDHWRQLDVSDEDWSLVLRSILNSVRTHSTGQKGSRRYLSFVQSFLAKMKANAAT